MDTKIVKRGIWLYDGTVEKPVDIIALDYDWWYELAKADGMLEPDEDPEPLGKEGYIYYVRFKRALETEGPNWVDSCGHQELKEAIKAAEAKVSGGIKWHL
jgi:hypothetical protein